MLTQSYESYTPEQWAKHALDGTRRFLEQYYADREGDVSQPPTSTGKE